MCNQGSSTQMGDPDTLPASAVEKVSCIPHFDALWFCYSPAYQLRYYYIWGNVDDCQQHWSSFWKCLKLRTKFKEQVAQGPDKATHPVFQNLRSKEAAETFWQGEFGHLNSERPPPADHDEQPTVASSTWGAGSGHARRLSAAAQPAGGHLWEGR